MSFLRLLKLMPLVLIFAVFNLSCAYRMGAGTRSIPGGYKTVSVPIFKNKSFETGVEVSFTNALLQELQRSRVAKVTNESLSEVRIEGEITDIKYIPGYQILEGDPTAPYMPFETVLTTSYDIVISVNLRVVRRSDNIEIWSGRFQDQRNYSAPQVTIAGLNSVNPLYNLSARRQYIDNLAVDMMAEAHNRMTESF